MLYPNLRSILYLALTLIILAFTGIERSVFAAEEAEVQDQISSDIADADAPLARPALLDERAANRETRKPAVSLGASTGNKAEWSLHVGGFGIHAPGTVDDRNYNVMPRKIDSMGIGVIAPGFGASYSKNKFGAGFIYLRGDSFGNKALILSTHYNFKTEKNYHMRLHFAIYGREKPVFYTDDRKVDYTMKWSHKTGKYEIFPIVFFNPAVRIAGPVWIEGATAYIISYIYLTVKF